MTTTDDIIADLAQRGAAVAPQVTMRRFVMPLVLVGLLCAAILIALLGAPFRYVETMGIGSMAVKWGFSLPIVIGAAFALYSLGRPGTSASRKLMFLCLPFAGVAVLLAIDLAIPGNIAFGATWPRCLAAMAVFSPVSFAGAIMAARWLAPTDLRKAGMVAGLFGGGVAMSVYAPFCPEQGMVYLLVFYVLPIIAMAAIGWLAGPKLLRW